MAKTNFTKVEEILNEGLRKITVDHLLDLADTVKAGDSVKVEPSSTSRPQTILALQRDMKFLHREGQEPYELFGINKKTINKYLKNPEALTPQDWEVVREIQKKVRKFKNEFEKNSPQKNNDDLIEQQRRRHINKRFNINEKWLPLT